MAFVYPIVTTPGPESILTTMIHNEAVTEPKIANGSVGNTKLTGTAVLETTNAVEERNVNIKNVGAEAEPRFSTCASGKFILLGGIFEVGPAAVAAGVSLFKITKLPTKPRKFQGFNYTTGTVLFFEIKTTGEVVCKTELAIGAVVCIDGQSIDLQ